MNPNPIDTKSWKYRLAPFVWLLTALLSISGSAFGIFYGLFGSDSLFTSPKRDSATVQTQLPDSTNDYFLSIYVDAPGLELPQIETEVVLPLEKAIAQLESVASVSSLMNVGRSRITVTMQPEVPETVASQRIQHLVDSMVVSMKFPGLQCEVSGE